MKLISTLLLFCSVLCQVSCYQQAPQEVKRTILKFGTLIDITLYDVEPTLAQKSLDQLEANFSQYHADWTSWQDSPLPRANKQLASGLPAQIPPSIGTLIKRSQILSQDLCWNIT